MAGWTGWALHNPKWLPFTQSTMRRAPTDWHSHCPCAPLALMTFKTYKLWNFPGCPVVKTLCFPCEALVGSPLWELRSHMPWGPAKKKKKKKFTPPAQLL